MNFRDYAKLIEDVPNTMSIKYQQAIMWIHNERLPLKVVSVGENASGVVRIPNYVANKSGHIVPVISIDKEAFAGCDKITDIILPSNLERILSGTFSGCSSLKRVVFPKKIRSIEECAFTGCINLEDVYYEGSMEEWKNVKIICQKHEIEFGNLIPGTPVQEIEGERLIHIPGNDSLLSANIHFHCSLPRQNRNSTFEIKMKNKNVTNYFSLM